MMNNRDIDQNGLRKDVLYKYVKEVEAEEFI